LTGAALEPVPFEVAGGGPLLSGESLGEGPDVILCHGLSATRRYVVHGSKVLPRRGYRLHTYDARGHGQSHPAEDSYGYRHLVDDLRRVGERVAAGSRWIVGGHSMGCHTALAFAMRKPEMVEALVLVGPVYTPDLDGEAELARWDERATALETGGPEAFGRAAAEGIESDQYRETVERLATERAALHLHPEAVAEALRQVPRSRPFASLGELDRLDLPALVAGTRDEADPGHPYEVARLYAERLPQSQFVVEQPGESPLSWQGGRLSREIAAFLERNGIAGRSAVPGG
jgi:pimeloyl-ACP methyl ester carboxylesterase